MQITPIMSSCPIKQARHVGKRSVIAAGLALMLIVEPMGEGPRANENAKAQPSAACGENGAVWWSEIITHDVKRTRQFYETVAGWSPKVVAHADPSRPPKAGETEYTIMMAAQREAIGLMIANHPDAIHPRGGWFNYIQVDDVDVSSAAAKANGGKVLRRPFDVPGIARIAVIEDPMGVAVGLVTPIKPAGC